MAAGVFGKFGTSRKQIYSTNEKPCLLGFLLSEILWVYKKKKKKKKEERREPKEFHEKREES